MTAPAPTRSHAATAAMPYQAMDQQEAKRWTIALGSVTALHIAAVIAATMWHSAPRIHRPPEPPPVLIDMAPLAGRGTPAGGSAPAPHRELSAPRPHQTPVQQTIRPVTPARIMPEAVAPPVPAAVSLSPSVVPAPLAAGPAAGSLTGASGEGDGQGRGKGRGHGESGGRGDVQGRGRGHGKGGGGDAMASWRSRVMAHLEHYKRYPPTAKIMKRQGRVLVAFTMDRSGHVVAASLRRADGFKAFDKEALAVLHRAEPLPVPPDEFSGDTVDLVVTVSFGLQGA